MKKMIVAIGLAMACAAEPASADYVGGSYWDGNNYMAASKAGRLVYLTGLTDGLLAAALMTKQNVPSVKALETCDNTLHISNGQFMAMADKFMGENPERWGESMSILAVDVYVLACRRVGIAL